MRAHADLAIRLKLPFNAMHLSGPSGTRHDIVSIRPGLRTGVELPLLDVLRLLAGFACLSEQAMCDVLPLALRNDVLRHERRRSAIYHHTPDHVSHY